MGNGLRFRLPSLRVGSCGGDGGSADQPSDFYATVKDALAPLGIEPSWSFKYNAGANPIAFPITFQNVAYSKFLEVLTQAYSLA